MAGTFAYFAELGRRLGTAWERHGWSEESFDHVALELLESVRVCDDIDFNTLLGEVFESEDLPRQYDPSAHFGEPPITVYSGPRFHIDINSWLNASLGIHEHGFRGAFQILSGGAAHVTYRFAEQKLISAAFSLGSMHTETNEFLQPGDSRRIIAGEPLAHVLYHLRAPSHTVVIRMAGQDRYQPQRSYVLPGIAFDPQHQHSSVFRRKVQFLNYLRATQDPSYMHRFQATLAAARLDEAWSLLTDYSRSLNNLDVNEWAPQIEQAASTIRSANEAEKALIVAGCIREVRQLFALEMRMLEIVDTYEQKAMLAVGMIADSPSDAETLLRSALGQAVPTERPFTGVAQLVADLHTHTKDPQGYDCLGLESTESRILQHLLDPSALTVNVSTEHFAATRQNLQRFSPFAGYL